ncbi:hypothetical protein ACRAWG_26005 [Methylobacterium sp. P31]
MLDVADLVTMLQSRIAQSEIVLLTSDQVKCSNNDVFINRHADDCPRRALEILRIISPSTEQADSQWRARDREHQLDSGSKIVQAYHETSDTMQTNPNRILRPAARLRRHRNHPIHRSKPSSNC